MTNVSFRSVVSVILDNAKQGLGFALECVLFISKEVEAPFL